MSHIPILLAEVIEAIAPRASDVIIDATFGAGGYTRAFLEEGARVIAFDRDPAAKIIAKKITQEFPDRFQFLHAPFSEMQERLAEVPSPVGGGLGWGQKVRASLDAPLLTSPLRGEGIIDAIVFDLGVSSMQLDEAERGFSFRQDGPLDMRMDGEGISAADIVNERSEKELADLFYTYGEEKNSRKIARAIVHDRENEPFERTKQLADLLTRINAFRSRNDKIHPATRVFQALRIEVNNEIGELEEGLQAAQKLLKTGGKLAVVTFHSLEDRPVKQFFTPERPPSATRLNGS